LSRNIVSVLLCAVITLLSQQGARAAHPELYRTTLPNGMQVVIYENHRNPLVSLNVFVKVGSMYESEHTNGISHFFEHLFFRGTTSRTGEQFKRDIESLGGITNAETTKDLTKFYINLPSQYARQGLDILSDALQHQRLVSSEIELERNAVLDEYKIGLENPGNILQTDLFDEAFHTHPYRMAIIGTEKSIKGITMTDLVDWRRRYYVPSRCTLIIVGDVTPASIMPTVKEYFAGFSGKDAGLSTVPQENISTPQVRQRTERRDLANGYVVMGFYAPSVRDRPDIYRTDVLAFLLGQGEGALLTKRLVDERKLALEVSADFLTQRDRGLLEIAATTQPNHLERTREAILATIQDVCNGKFTPADFARAKVMLHNTYLFGNETNSGIADGLGFYASIDKVDFALDYLDEVDKVTMDDVITDAKKYLTLNNYSLLMIKPPEHKAMRDLEGGLAHEN
jgi:zinc protease